MTSGYPTHRRDWPTLATLALLMWAPLGCSTREAAAPAAPKALSPSTPTSPFPSSPTPPTSHATATHTLTFREVGGERSLRWSAATTPGGLREIHREVLAPSDAPADAHTEGPADASPPVVQDRTTIRTRVDASGQESLISVRVESQKAETVFDPPLPQPSLGTARGQSARVDRAAARVMRDASRDPLIGEAEQTVEAIDPAPGAPPGSVAWRIDLTIRLGPSVTRTRTERTIAPVAHSPAGELWAESRRLTVHVLGVRIEKQEDAWQRAASPGQ
jgi:hypothetical protein